MNHTPISLVLAATVLAALTLHCNPADEIQVVTATVSGTVSSDADQAVSAINVVGESGVSVSIAGQSTTTGASGAYSISNVPVGRQTMMVKKGSASEYVDFGVVAPETTYNVRAPVDPARPDMSDFDVGLIDGGRFP